MALVPMKQILDEARKKGYAVGGYNITNMEQTQGIIRAAYATDSPIIIQATKGALEYGDFIFTKHLALAASELYPKIPIALHLDHGPDLAAVKKAVALGFTSVMIDGSIDYSQKDKDGSHPARSYQDNARLTKTVVNYAHRFGVTVEGELGTLGGIEDDTKATKVLLTDPAQAEEFVHKTGVDALAIAIGTSHGAYKFKAEPKLAMDIVKQVRARLPDTALVLHGASSVPQELAQRCIDAGLGMKAGGKGVPLASLKNAIRLGISKINVDTDGRLAFMAGVAESIREYKGAIDIRQYLGPGRDEVTKWYIEKMKAFGTAGHAKDYHPSTLADLMRRYAM